MRFSARVAVIAAAVALLGAAPARAQLREQSGGVRLLIGGGSTFALGEFGDAFNNGPHVVLGAAVRPVGFPIGFRVDGTYHRIAGDEDVLLPDDLDTRILSGTASAVFNFNASAETSLRPYLLAGAGVYNYKAVGDDVPDGTESESDFGISAGAGFDYRVGDNLGIFLEGRFHRIFTENEAVAGSTDTTILPISLGVRIGRS